MFSSVKSVIFLDLTLYLKFLYISKFSNTFHPSLHSNILLVLCTSLCNFLPNYDLLAIHFMMFFLLMDFCLKLCLLYSLCCCFCIALSILISPWTLQPWYSQHTIGRLYYSRIQFAGRALFTMNTVHTDQTQQIREFTLEEQEYHQTREYYFESVYWFYVCKGYNLYTFK